MFVFPAYFNQVCPCLFVCVFEWVLHVVVGVCVCKWWVCQCLCMVACHNTADTQAINLLTLWGQFDRGLMFSVTEWNLFIIPNVMVSSLRAFFSSLSVSVSLSLAFPSFLIFSLVQFGKHSPYFLHPYPSFPLSLIPHSCLVLLLSILSWSSGLHYSPSIFISLLWLFTSSFTPFLLHVLSLSLSCSYIHHHIFSFFAHLFLIPSAISERISQNRQEQARVIFHPQNRGDYRRFANFC